MKDDLLSIVEILSILSGKVKSLIFILLVIPFCQLVQVPGLSIPFVFAMNLHSLKNTLRKSHLVIKQAPRKKMSFFTFEKITNKILALGSKIESWIHPRLVWMCHSSFIRKGNG
ncbi:MAG: exopolysaccharide biosynthesis protein [Rhabdochlamydiaceae bacterium]|nr:exopolysaccharide biosynthesis protein [Rhabdochlamydiaceae bacterium]